jgi:hypothetical protein
MSIEMPDILKTFDDLNSFDEVNRILKSPEALKAIKPFEKFTGNVDDIAKGPLDKVMGPIGTAFDLYNTYTGVDNLHEGFTEDGTDAMDDVAIVDGVHDLLDGGSGLLGNVKGPVGAVAKAFNAGFTVGDMIAPYVFNDAKYEGARTETIPENGEFHAETGNESVDEIIDGVHDISDGNYLDGALDIADGATGVLSPIIPGGGVIEGVKDLWEWGSGEE